VSNLDQFRALPPDGALSGPTPIQARVQRERRIYEEGLDRGGYEDLLASHAGYMHGLNRNRIAKAAFSRTRLERVLEIGEFVWYHWLEGNHLLPRETFCINISERELNTGVAKSRHTRLKPTFLLMDAHRLDFPDQHFDAVCGCGILHHLELGVALDEIARVLRPDGVVVFSEPLDNNPVARLVRRLTPWARTEDEVPFRSEHLAEIARRFDCELHYEQLISVPLGLISRLVFETPDNSLMRLAFRCDDALQRRLARSGPYFRKVTIVGRKRTAVA
jgi:SAM-dependent methyltransferase